MSEIITNEIYFWVGFIVLNGLNYVVNYVLHIEKSFFFPYISDVRTTKKLGLIASQNQDFFRYSVELSFILFLGRFVDLQSVSVAVTIIYLIGLFFNLYQYSLRHIYNYEPNFYNDLKLLKNGFVIVWHESKVKLIAALMSVLLLSIGFYYIFQFYFGLSFQTNSGIHFWAMLVLWVAPLLRAIQKFGLYKAYPNDIYLRYHWISLEILQNIIRSIANYEIATKKLGLKYRKSRQKIELSFKDVKPNIYLIFIESYGSYFYKENKIKKESMSAYDSFVQNLASKGWKSKSNLSKSPTTGGQSWLTYSSFLYGTLMDNNTLFENFLHDEDFLNSNSLLKIFQNQGYTNYNLNPINPIKGINVPYDEMRKFYVIDRWFLNPDLEYSGDVYGFGECPPDQFAMNKAMEVINKEDKGPYTFFYLTKNSHSPFVSPRMVSDWKSLNHKNGRTHVHKGFLKQPEVEDYYTSIVYQFDNIEKFISDYGKQDDVFLLIGDHQPPILSDPNIHGFETPVHIVSRNQKFLDGFKDYGFLERIEDLGNYNSHQELFSIFLRVFSDHYCDNKNNPIEYEPNGLELY